MNILVINAGSSSLKCSLFDYSKAKPKLLHKAYIENIKTNKHAQALNKILKEIDKKFDLEIDAIGNRVVHGGEKYSQAVKINYRVTKDIEKLSKLAPLHNPANLAAIKAAKKAIPKAKLVAVFDTAFHQTMPEKAYLYGLPFKLYKKHGIRRYGFHGTSHKYVIDRCIKITRSPNAKIISCHIGNGISITASKSGKSLDTSMGFTPLEGPLMGTRCGSIDPAIVNYMEKTLKLSSNKIDELMNKKAGLLGLSEISSDMRKIYAAYKKKKPAAIRTMNTLAYQIAKYIGAYAASLNGVDSIIFTATMGEKAFYLRTLICKYLEYLGVDIDSKSNRSYKEGEVKISTKNSKIKVFVIPTNEELQIATESKAILCT